ncbi:MAG: hypothetical protein ABW199_02950 [Caulobacterales bacterium]
MRGQILGVDGDNGILLGPQDERRSFALTEWKSAGYPQAGQQVDFLEDGEGARSVYVVATGFPAHHQPAISGSQSVVFGSIGCVCLAVGILFPVLPTIAAFILGIVGADRAKADNDKLGLLLSRISWIGALVLLGLGVAVLALIVAFFGGVGAWLFQSGGVPPIHL